MVGKEVNHEWDLLRSQAPFTALYCQVEEEMYEAWKTIEEVYDKTCKLNEWKQNSGNKTYVMCFQGSIYIILKTFISIVFLN